MSVPWLPYRTSVASASPIGGLVQGQQAKRRYTKREILLKFALALVEAPNDRRCGTKTDLPPKFHPTGTGVLLVDTPFGVEGATDRCA